MSVFSGLKKALDSPSFRPRKGCVDIIGSKGGVRVVGLGGNIIRRSVISPANNIANKHFFGGGRGDRMFLLAGHAGRVIF